MKKNIHISQNTSNLLLCYLKSVWKLQIIPIGCGSHHCYNVPLDDQSPQRVPFFSWAENSDSGLSHHLPDLKQILPFRILRGPARRGCLGAENIEKDLLSEGESHCNLSLVKRLLPVMSFILLLRFILGQVSSRYFQIHLCHHISC